MKNSRTPSAATLILIATLPSAYAQTATTGASNLSYVGANTRIGVGIDSDVKGRAEIWHVLNATDTSALIGEVWAARHRAAGAQLQYNWLGGSLGDLANARVHKVFAAIDQNSDRARKITVGYGQEREAYHWSAYLSKGLNKDILVGTREIQTLSVTSGADPTQGPFTQNVSTLLTTQTFAKPFDWGLGVRAGKWYGADTVRFTAGLDYEWGDESNRLLAASLQAEKYFPYSPISISLLGGIGSRSGPLVVDKGVHFGQLMVRYDLFGNGKWSQLSQGAGWRGPAETKKMETVTEMRTETRTEMRAETREVDVPTQVTIPANTAASTTKTEARVVVKEERKDLETYFDLGQAGLTPKAKTDLAALMSAVQASSQRCKVAVNVVGHTCPTGSDRNNIGLSQRRADAVKDFLAKAGAANASYSTAAQAGRAPKYPEVKGQTFRNRRADTQAVISCEVTENVTVQVPGAITAARTETRIEKRKESVQVPVQVQVQVPVQVQKERVEYTPLGWVPRALMASTPHLQTVSTYDTQKSITQVVTGARNYTNQCPAPVNDAATVAAGSSATMIDVLANDKDADGNALTITSITQPANGTASIVGGKVSYTPRAGFNGSDTLTYTVTDGFCGTKTAAVALTVTAAAAPPAQAALQCKAQSYQFKCGTGADIDLNGAVSGGTGAYTYTLPARGIYGIISDLGGGRFRYEANRSICFDREFIDYTAKDANGATCTGKIELIDPPKRSDGIQ